jgi:hypothetical protein
MLDAESSILLWLDAGSMLCLDGGSIVRCLLDAS